MNSLLKQLAAALQCGSGKQESIEIFGGESKKNGWITLNTLLYLANGDRLGGYVSESI